MTAPRATADHLLRGYQCLLVGARLTEQIYEGVDSRAIDRPPDNARVLGVELVENVLRSA